MEGEAREILKAALRADTAHKPNFAESLRRHVKALGGVELLLGKREAVRRPPRFGR